MTDVERRAVMCHVLRINEVVQGHRDGGYKSNLLSGAQLEEWLRASELISTEIRALVDLLQGGVVR